MTSAKASTTVDDDSVRVTTWTFEDGQDTGHHTHQYDYVVVPVTGGSFIVTEATGATRELQQEAGVAYAGRAGTEHNVANSSGLTAVFVEIELKRSA